MPKKKKITPRSAAAKQLLDADLAKKDENPAGWSGGSRGYFLNENERLAISGAGGDPDKDRALLRGMYFGDKDYRPNLLNEPRPEEQQSRNFTPAWDTTYGGPFERRPDPKPRSVTPRNGGAAEAIATSMANDLAFLDWLAREEKRRSQDAEQEQIVRARAESTNKGRDAAYPPSRLKDPMRR